MSNGKDMIDQMELEKQMEKWSAPEQFIARQVYEIKKNCVMCNPSDSGGKKRTITNAASGGLTGAIVAGIAMLIEYLRGH